MLIKGGKGEESWCVMKVSVRCIFWYLIGILFLFQNALDVIIPSINMLDDIIALVAVFWIADAILNSRKLKKDIVIMLGLISGIMVIGLISTFFSDISRPVVAIVFDMWNTIKVFVGFIGAMLHFQRRPISEKLLKILAATIRTIVFIAFILMILSQFVDLGMTAGMRYGFKCFKFVYSGAGMFSQYCAQYMLILTLDAKNKPSSIKKIAIILNFVIWISTMRSRGFVITILYALLLIYFKKANSAWMQENIKRFKKLLRPDRLIIVLVLILLVGSSQIKVYFGSDVVSSRGLFLRYGITTMLTYFPLGAGFATFGTEAASRFYSPLYYHYGMNRFWALTEKGSQLTDCYWPAIAAEFGVIGLALVSMLVFFYIKSMIKLSMKRKNFLLAAIVYTCYLIISSTATGAFNSYVTLEFSFLFAMLVSEKSFSSNIESLGTSLKME